MVSHWMDGAEPGDSNRWTYCHFKSVVSNITDKPENESQTTFKPPNWLVVNVILTTGDNVKIKNMAA